MVQLSTKSLFRDAGSIRGYALLDLGGQSIRGADSLGEDILIIADDPEAEGCQPFFWDGKTSTPSPFPWMGWHFWIRRRFLSFPIPNGRFSVLSDDGGRRRGEKTAAISILHLPGFEVPLCLLISKSMRVCSTHPAGRYLGPACPNPPAPLHGRTWQATAPPLPDDAVRHHAFLRDPVANQRASSMFAPQVFPSCEAWATRQDGASIGDLESPAAAAFDSSRKFFSAKDGAFQAHAKQTRDSFHRSRDPLAPRPWRERPMLETTMVALKASDCVPAGMTPGHQAIKGPAYLPPMSNPCIL